MSIWPAKTERTILRETPLCERSAVTSTFVASTIIGYCGQYHVKRSIDVGHRESGVNSQALIPGLARDIGVAST